MARKIFVCTLAVLISVLFSGICFAADSGNSINLGNEIMQSIDKTGNSMRNVVSGNVVRDAGNMIKDGTNAIRNGINNVGNSVNNGVNHVENGMNNGMNEMRNDGNYNVTRTTAEGTTMATNTMTTTTWMWIILALAATIIFVAVWYYATQDNG